MEEDIAQQLDSFSLNNEESIHAIDSPTPKSNLDRSRERSIYFIIYGGESLMCLALRQP